MFDKFGEFDSAEEINKTADGLFNEGDDVSIDALAEENGIDKEMVKSFINGEMPMLCDGMTAAIGKIDIEAADLKPQEIMADWIDYLKTRCFESEEMAKAVRKKGKNLKSCIAELLTWSMKNAKEVDKDILKAVGITYKVTLGIPGMGRAKQIITNYYLG